MYTRKLRKTSVFLLVLALLLSLFGAVGSASGETQTQTVLVAYFSHTGNTEKAAEQIAELTGGTLAEITRTEPYGEDLLAVSKAEIEQGERPAVTVGVENVEDYDVIFVGYPIWYSETPAVIRTFLESYDFAGKTLVPFCTSSSSAMDDTLHNFSDLCPDAVIAEGLRMNHDADVPSWLNRIGVTVSKPTTNTPD